MAASIVGKLTPTQIQQALSQSQAITGSASQTISSYQFVFFGAFDGTNNNANDPSSIPAGEQTTNVGQLFDQYQQTRQSNVNLGGNYYPGPGTSDSRPWSSWLPSQVTQEAINTGTKAYKEFQDQARVWLDANPGADPNTTITVAVTSFSRGINAASVFAQLLYEKGLTDSYGTVLIPPGQLGISAGAIFDPVRTGMSGNISFPLAQNVVVIQAENEYRYPFEAVDYTGQPGFMTFSMLGNHCDIGGGYDNGLGAINLQSVTGFLQHSGLALANVPANRQFDANANVVVHNEGIDDYTKEAWSTYGTYGEYSGPRLTSSVTGGPTMVEVMADGSTVETFILYDGRIIKRTTAADGSITSTIKETGTSTLQQSTVTLIDALKLVKAIQSGEPLPPLASGLRVANDLSNLNDTPNLNLSGTAYAASGILSLMSLNAALKEDDALAGLTAGAQAVTFAATAYANFAGYASLNKAINEGTFGAAGDAVGAIDGAQPYLSIINSLAHEDYVGAAVNAASLYITPYIGWAYAIYSIVDSLFSDDDVPKPRGNGQFVWSGNGISYQATGRTGGYEAVTGVMDSTLATLNALIERVREGSPGSQLGIIPNRMPSVAYDMSGYRYIDIDPLTGVEKHSALRFDTSGRPYNAEPGSSESYQSIVEAMVRSALSRGAIAPLWEVQTAKLQTDAGDPKAGLTEDERAGRDGQLAAPVAADTQIFRPVALDLDGDGIETTDKAHGVVFDVDDSGYLKPTAWVQSDDALLVLDRDYNGQFDSGRELFSNGMVALGRRGLAGIAWVDANYDGKLTAADPVWNELKLWRDLDQDGQQDVGEVQGLDGLGISELNYAMGTFTQNSVKKQLASPDLEADSQGIRITTAPEGIVVQTSVDGHLSLIVTRIDDKTTVEANPDDTTNYDDGNTAIEANGDGITGYEDVEIIVSSADLLANDTLGGIPGRDLSIVGLTNFRHGTGFIDANGFVHFIPEANYAGNEAGFDYVAQASNGETGTATVDITLQNINDTPTLDQVEHELWPVYGYTPVVYATTEWGEQTGIYASGGNPIYEPYATVSSVSAGSIVTNIVYNPPPNLTGAFRMGAVYHTTPITTEDTGKGQIIGSDVDDPAMNLTYELVGLPQYGAVAVNPDGTFQYTSWEAQGVASDRIVINGQYAGLSNLYGQNSLTQGEGHRYYDQLFYPNAPFPSIQNEYIIYPTTDVFQVKITDPHGASTLQSISVPHYGPYFVPRPPSGGGGKKPIAVDLDGNGFEFVNVDDSNVFFDVNGDGWKRRISWVGQSDGLLAYDIDGNGKIDQAGEISFTRYMEGAQSDLEGLRAFDSNGDGRFDAADEKWAKFGVWQDVNQNGVTDPGEFRSLSEIDIVAVNLMSDGEFQVINGQTVHGLGSMIRTDSSEIAIADVTLAYSNETQIPQGNGTTQTVSTSPFSPSGERIDGTEDNDLILGKNGSNIVNGDGGNDVIFEDGGNDIVDGGDGNDLIYSGADNDLVMGGVGDDVIYAGLSNDVVFGGNGNDAIFAEGGNDIVFSGAGNDLISGGWGSDVLSGDDGDDQIFGESGNDALFGGNGDDELFGMGGTDYLNGGADNDTLDGSAGSDKMIGGTGDDTYMVDDIGDTVTELADEGNDTARTALDGYTLGANVENLTLTGSADLAGFGNKLDNILTGNAGANRLDGNAGADTMIGGAGNDTYIVDDVNDVAVEFRNGGSDTVLASIGFMLPEHVENLTLTGNAATNGVGNALDNLLVGNSAANMLDGAAGDDLLDGGLGSDTLIGGAGDDTYIVDNTGDVVTELAGEGSDLVLSSISHTLSANVENLTLSGEAAIDGTGNALNNTLIGNATNNVLNGEAGEDLLDGGVGNDTLRGGLGNDTYRFGRGDGQDTIAFDEENSADKWNILEFKADIAPGDVSVRRSGETLILTLAGSENRVTVNSFFVGGMPGTGATNPIQEVHFADGTVWDLATLVAKALAGTDSADSISGTTDGDLLDGEGGNDTFYGGSGNDTLLGGDGNDGLYGEAGNDTLFGGSGSDIFYGGSGDDALDGGLGNDILSGGLGNDTYRFGEGDSWDVIYTDPDDSAGKWNVLEFKENVHPDEVVVVRSGVNLWLKLAGSTEGVALQGFFSGNAPGTGIDNPVQEVKFADGTNWDMATLVVKAMTGTDGADNISGTTGTNILQGGAGNDTLTDASGSALFHGGTGNDTMVGGAGAEIFVGGQGNDTYGTGEGNDIILFNKGDGQDIFASGGTGSDTLSLGGSGLNYDDLAFAKSSSDLILKIGATDQITFKDWYASTPSNPVARLQVMAEAMDGFTPGGSDPLKDQKVENFDFAGLVGAFDTACAADSGLTSWALSHALLDFQLGGSDTAAIGGDLAYLYGKNGSLAGIGVTPALGTLSDAGLGSNPQELSSLSSLQTGTHRIS